MPAERLSMRKVREILRLRLGLGLSLRDVGRSVRVSSSTVSDCVSRAVVAGLGWPLPDGLDDAGLEARAVPTGQWPAQSAAAGLQNACTLSSAARA